MREFVEETVQSKEGAYRPKGMVDIRPLKSLVSTSYPKDTAIYDIILTERDLLDASEFLSKVDVWLKLTRRVRI